MTGGVRILGGCEGDGKGVKVVGGTYCTSVGSLCALIIWCVCFLYVQCNEGSLHLAQLQLPAKGHPDEVVALVISNRVGPSKHSTLTNVLLVVQVPILCP